MLPNIFKDWISYRPKSREEKNIQEYFRQMQEQGISKNYLDRQIITEDEALNALNYLKIDKDSIFYEFYKTFRSTSDELYELNEILENYQSQNWITLLPEKVKNEFKEKYPNAGERYLQITSIEGGGSYFYDKETDYVYNVDWGEEENMITGKLKPWFTSFYDFLEWYYSEEE
jgi:hypothetical protein